MAKKFWLTVDGLLLTALLFAQTQKFDIVRFVPPQGWQRRDTAGTVAFLQSRTTNGQSSFCQIILFPSSVSTGNVTNDFKTAWNNMVTLPTKSTVKPVTEITKTPEGWQVMKGAANISQPGIAYTSLVVTATGFGRTLSVLVNMAGNEYVATVDKFFKDFILDSKTTASNNRQNTDATNNPINMNKAITLNDYDFIAPEGWRVQNNKDHIQIQNMQSGCLIRIIAPQPSSGDLEKDAKAVFDMMYNGWQFQKSGEQQYVLSKGFLPKGLEYFMMEAPMSMTGSDGRYNLEEGAALIVKAGTQIAIISVRHNSSLLAHDACYRRYNTWRRFFNSFTVKNAAVAKNEEDVSKRIIGKWEMSESGASGGYIFAANGNYAFSGAIGSSYTTADYRYEYLHIKTYAFQGDGSYSLSGNQLTLKKHGGRDTEQVRLRFEKVNRGGTGWKDRLCMLKKASFGENEVCYEKQNP